MKILIVDDDRARAEGLRSYLSSDGSLQVERIDIAESSGEAKQSLQNRYYDALVADVVLPKRRGESPSHEVGLALVGQVHRGRGLKKPEKVVAITGYEQDIERFRSDFEEYCTAVVRAYGASDEWRHRILQSILYLNGSKVSRVVEQGETVVFSIHGIRTHGEWQSRLQRLISEMTDEFGYYTYKYGYFSAIAFLFPPARAREVRRLDSRIEHLLHSKPKRVVVFAHSFGTYLAVEAIARRVSDLPSDVDLTLVLCGSVLPENYDWSAIRKHGSIAVINDCGVGDSVLLLSKIAAIGLGMAGRVGFNGFNGPRFMNRWYKGGHSHYFEGDEFMRGKWLPLVIGETVQAVDERGSPKIHAVVIDGVARMICALKWGIYFCLSAACFVLLR